MPVRAFASGAVFGVTHGSPPFRVVALPGWLHTVADWEPMLRALADAGVAGVALDLPGFGGATPEPPAPMGSAGYAAAIAPVLDELGGPVVLVGHSFGGRTALHLAAARPASVAALVLTGVPNLLPREGPRPQPPVAYRIARALHRRGLLPDARMEELRRRSGSEDYRNAPSVTMRNVLVAVTNEDYEAQLRTLRMPVELVWGADDTAAPIATARRAAELLGDLATLTVVPGVDHFTPTRATEALAAAVRRHVAP